MFCAILAIQKLRLYWILDCEFWIADLRITEEWNFQHSHTDIRPIDDSTEPQRMILRAQQSVLQCTGDVCDRKPALIGCHVAMR